MAATPYLTSNQLIEAVKRKIMFPIDQNTFGPNEILAFANEEMSISQVPAVMQYHQEYFVYFVKVPLQSNQSRYTIPSRAIGMRLRDIMWSDEQNNLFEMTRVNSDDKAFWQKSSGTNGTTSAFYLEGNEVVLTSGVTDSPTGNLNYYIFLRPNQLVVNERAAIVQSFQCKISLDNDFIHALDTIVLNNRVPFTAVDTLGGTITAILPTNGTTTNIICPGHQLSSNQTIVISGSDCLPSINGTYVVTVQDENTFTIPKQIGVAGTTGTFICKNQFQKGSTSIDTAANLATSFINSGLFISANNGSPSSNIVTVNYDSIFAEFTTESPLAFGFDTTTVGITFNSLPSTYTDPLTNITTPLFVSGTLVDFLQTNPGHRTYVYDVVVPSVAANTIYFAKEQMMYYTNTDGFKKVINLKIGDYICLANESIIPQIPPELHTGLAERTSARILAALGDRDGLAVVNQKIQDIQLREGTLIDARVDGSPMKISGRHSLLRYNKFRSNRM